MDDNTIRRLKLPLKYPETMRVTFVPNFPGTHLLVMYAAQSPKHLMALSFSQMVRMSFKVPTKSFALA